METKPINPTNSENKKNEKSSTFSTMAAGVAGAVAGAAASMARDAFAQTTEEDSVNPDPVPVVDPDPEPPVNPDPEPPVNPDPEPPVNPDPSPSVNPDPKENVDPDEPFVDPAVNANDPDPEQGETTPTQQEAVNVNDVVDDIIAIEEIDPNDIDAEDIMAFDELGVIYTEDGGIYNVAMLHDGYGEDYVLVDIDGDLYFDVLTDTDFNYLADVDNLVSVNDVESSLNDGSGYLAADDTTSYAIEHTDFTQDITT